MEDMQSSSSSSNIQKFKRTVLSAVPICHNEQGSSLQQLLQNYYCNVLLQRCLLLSPNYDQVPRGQAIPSLVENGLYVYAFKLEKIHLFKLRLSDQRIKLQDNCKVMWDLFNKRLTKISFAPTIQ